MTLEAWVKKGNPMLSNYTSALCCRELGINERQLRKMELSEIYNIPGWGVVAKREHERWLNENPV